MQNPALKCIMVSAYGDMGNIRQAMNNGAFDFATKPIDLDDLSVTIEKAIEQINYIKQSQQEHSQLESLKTDLAVAGEIQQAILPRVFPPFPEIEDILDVAASMTPAKDVGGDFYDFFRIDEERIGFVMADVSGKGVPAAIFMAVSRTLIRAIGMQGIKAEETMMRANELLCKESVNCMFVTVFYAIYNTKTGEVEYCNAGHNSPYLIHANGQVEALPMSTNCMIGAIEGLTFNPGSLKMEKGDMLVMYTDGVNEAVNNDFEEYGDQRLLNTLSQLQGKACQETIDGLLDSVKTFTDGAPQSDDITLLSFKRK
jgi:sigma-B regulation protein RsbU (phosphoserine phosphatase)